MSTPYPYPGPNPYPATVGRWYRVRGPVGALTVLLILTAVANGLLILALIGLRATVDEYVEGTTDLESVDDMIAFAGFALLVVGGLTIAVFVLTIVWQWRLAKNHEQLGRPGTTFGPGWAIGAWFIPLANLVIPILQFLDLWKGSAPGLPRYSEHWKRQSSGALIWVWWGIFVASFVVDWASSLGVDEQTDEFVELSGQLDRVTGLAVLAYSLRIAAAILFIVVIKQLTARQEAAVAEVAFTGGLMPAAVGPGWAAGTGPLPASAFPFVPPGAAPIAPPGELSPGWKPDPTGRAHHRYWDGARWTDHASTGGNAFISPM